MIEYELEVRRQFVPLVESDKRWFCVVAHRRAGKTCAAIQKLVRSAIECDNPSPRFAFIAPLYKQAKAVAWDYLKHMARPMNAVINEAELRADLPNGARIRLFGADNPDSLRGLYLDGVVMDEVAQMPVSLWSEVIRPALSDRQGWAYFSGTPKGKNVFYDIWKDAQGRDDWTSLMLKASETGLLLESELDMAKRDMTEAEYEQEYECSFSAAIRGAYYAKEMESVYVGSVPHDPALRVTTTWDLGISDSTVVWFIQAVGGEIRAINCLAFQSTGLPDIIRELEKLPYLYEQHIFPHDVRVRELGTGKSRVDMLKALGIKASVAPNLSIADGISATRAIIPRMCFDADECKDGIEALRQYRTQYDDRRQVFRNNPLHDWCSDYADSLRYYAVTKKKTLSTARYDDWDQAVNT